MSSFWPRVSLLGGRVEEDGERVQGKGKALSRGCCGRGGGRGIFWWRIFPVSSESSRAGISIWRS
eukprot:285474-Hanusia_phi.AAC.1